MANEIEVALKDSISAAMKQIGANLNDLQKQALDVGKIGSVSLNRLASDLNRSGSSVSRLSEAFGTIRSSISSVTSGLSGPVGMAAGFLAAAKSLETFTAGRQQLQQFANTVGFTVENIQNIQQATQRLGGDISQANSLMANLGGKLNQLAVLREGSPIWQSLQMGGKIGIELANRLKGYAAVGDQMGAFNDILRTFNTLTETSQKSMAMLLGTDVGVLRGMAEALAENVPPRHFTDEDLRIQHEYNRKYIDIETKFYQELARVQQEGIKIIVDANDWLNKIAPSYEAALSKAWGVIDRVRAMSRPRPRSPGDYAGPTGPGSVAAPQGYLTSGAQYSSSPHLGGGEGGPAGPYGGGGREIIGGGSRPFSAPHRLLYPPVPPPGWATSPHLGAGEGGPAGPYGGGGRTAVGGGSRPFSEPSDLNYPAVPPPGYVGSPHRGGGEGGPAGPSSPFGTGRLAAASYPYLSGDEFAGRFGDWPSPGRLESATMPHLGGGQGGPAGPYGKGDRFEVGAGSRPLSDPVALNYPAIPLPGFASSPHLGGGEGGPAGPASPFGAGRVIMLPNIGPIPAPEYMWGHSGLSSTRHTLGGGRRDEYSLSGSLINSRGLMGTPDLMRRFGSGTYTRTHIVSNEGFAGPTGPGGAAGGMMMPPGLDFSKLGTMSLPPTSADQLGKGGPTAMPDGSLMGHALGYPKSPGFLQRLKSLFGFGVQSISYTPDDQLEVAEDNKRTLTDISATLDRIAAKGGLGGGARATGDYGLGPTFRKGIGPGSKGKAWPTFRRGIGPGRRGDQGLLGPAGGADQLTKELDLKSGEWDAYRQGMADIESSGGKYELTGGSSGRFSGAYQFGAAEISDTAKLLGETPPSRQQFLSDPAMQERYMSAYTLQHHRELMQNPKYAAMSPREKLVMLGYAHNQGVGGAKNFLVTGQAGRDAFGTSGTAYGATINRRLAELDRGGSPGSGLARSGGAPGETDDLPAHIVHEAQTAALSGGGPAVKRFMSDNGYPNHGEAWCGEFAASVVRKAGGRPPENPAIASNWRNWGTPTSTPVPGDIAVRRGVRTGSTGSHVTTVETGVDPETGRFGSIGGNQGAMRQSMPASRYEFFHAPEGPGEREARQRLNNSYRSKAPSTNVEIRVTNIPSGVKVSHESDADNTTVTKEKAAPVSETVVNIPSGI